MSLSFFNTLTLKQKKVYSAIELFIKSNGIPPTVREIGEMIGEKTPGAVQGILNRLEQKGVIKRKEGMARSIQLMSQEFELYVTPQYIPQIKKISMRNIDELLNIYNIYNYLPVPPGFIESGKKHFIIKCSNDSLAESGIKPGDMLLVSMDEDLKDNDIVLALYNNRLLLRRYYRGSGAGSLILKADSDPLDKEIFKTEQIKISGKVIGKYTKY
jgi:repressor LexA